MCIRDSSGSSERRRIGHGQAGSEVVCVDKDRGEPRDCGCGSSKLSASEFSMQEASPWAAALRMARSSTAVHRCQLVELSLVYQDPGVNLPPNPDSDRIWFGIGNC